MYDKHHQTGHCVLISTISKSCLSGIPNTSIERNSWTLVQEMKYYYATAFLMLHPITLFLVLVAVFSFSW
jgi:hypothetical protein